MALAPGTHDFDLVVNAARVSGRVTPSHSASRGSAASLVVIDYGNNLLHHVLPIATPSDVTPVADARPSGNSNLPGVPPAKSSIQGISPDIGRRDRIS